MKTSAIVASYHIEDVRNILNVLYARRDCYGKRSGEYLYHQRLIEHLRLPMACLVDDYIWVDHMPIEDQRYIRLAKDADDAVRAARGM